MIQSRKNAGNPKFVALAEWFIRDDRQELIKLLLEHGKANIGHIRLREDVEEICSLDADASSVKGSGWEVALDCATPTISQCHDTSNLIFFCA